MDHPGRLRLGLVLVVLVALSVSGCAAGQSPLPAAPSVASSSIAVSTPSPAASRTLRPTPPPIGQTADDGAAIVQRVDIDPRTVDLTVRTPSVFGLATVRLLLPSGFDASAATRWPVLYLLHGRGGSHVDWTDLTDVADLTADQGLIVAMPDGGEDGWYSDWWNEGKGGPPMWETFHVTELTQLLERNWHASDRRVVAGLSMGGLGALVYAARHPDTFRAAASYSGVTNPLGISDTVGPNDWWGDPVAQKEVWRAHDPTELATKLKGVRLYVSYGDGGKGPLDAGTVPSDDVEPWIAGQNRSFVARLKKLGIPATVDAYGPGSHDWPYWERALHRSLPMLVEALSG